MNPPGKRTDNRIEHERKNEGRKTRTERRNEGIRHSKQAEREDSTEKGIERGSILQHREAVGGVRKDGRGSKQGV